MGKRLVDIRKWDWYLLLVLIFLGIQSIMYFGEWWFFADTRRSPALFILLSFAIFWGVFRDLINWCIYFFIRVPHQPDMDEAKYSVDVLTTAMPGEPFEMFATTLKAIQEMDYPHQCFLLDGGDSPELKELCDKLGVNHINCKGVEGAKAGKINYCLQNYSQSDLVFIIDPDHRPRKDFLTTTVPHFQNEKTGFVQVVQAYYNRKDSFVASAASEQTFGFYGPILMGLQGLGIPTAIGANCLFRRKALDSIGGHAQHLAEDALTSMRLHSKGWESVYLPFRGTEGLVPTDLSSFYKQQYKWSTGMFYILKHEYKKLFKDFNWRSRLHYFGVATFYFNGLTYMLHLFLPILLLLGQLYAVEFTLTEFLIHFLPYVFISYGINVLIRRWYTHSSEKRSPWRSMVLEKSTWHIYARAMLAGLGGKTVHYDPTPKDKNTSAQPEAVWPNTLVVLATLAAILWSFYNYQKFDDGTILMIAFAILNIVLLLPVLIVGYFGDVRLWREK
jgi:cellulose synthase (UDP-forming)